MQTALVSILCWPAESAGLSQFPKIPLLYSSLIAQVYLCSPPLRSALLAVATGAGGWLPGCRAALPKLLPLVEQGARPLPPAAAATQAPF